MNMAETYKSRVYTDRPAYADFDANTLLDSVQDSLCEEIVEKLVDDIFTASVAQW